MCFSKEQFCSYRKTQAVAIYTADNAVLYAQGIGNVQLIAQTDQGEVDLILHDVLHVPALQTNLVSVLKIVQKGHSVIFTDASTSVVSSQGQVIATAKRSSTSLQQLQAVVINMQLKKAGSDDDCLQLLQATCTCKHALWGRRGYGWCDIGLLVHMSKTVCRETVSWASACQL